MLVSRVNLHETEWEIHAEGLWPSLDPLPPPPNSGGTFKLLNLRAYLHSR